MQEYFHDHLQSKPRRARLLHMARGDNLRKLSPQDVGEIVRRYTTRLPDGTWEGTPSIARDLGVSIPTVARWLRQQGIPRRDARESHAGGKRCKPITCVPVGEAPECACGCGGITAWNQRKNRWNRYTTGHYRRDAPYKSADWLRDRYVTEQLTVEQIAAESGVSAPVIAHFMDLARIARRDASEAHVGRQAGPLNPAWKGGVADWPYSPDWKVLARKIRDRDRWTCQDCGMRRPRWGAALHVHHVDENKLNNDPANLISLCARCHRIRHGGPR